MKKVIFAVFALSVLFMGCSQNIAGRSNSKAIIAQGEEPADVAGWEADVDADFKAVMEALGTAKQKAAISEFDAKYGTDISSEVFGLTDSARASSKSSGNYPALTDMPFAVDGAVYLSGGTSDLVGTVIDWVSPKTFPGSYYHGAVLDLDKYDPNNEDNYCLETAITKGAGYESATEWRNKVNARVLYPNSSLNKSKLDAAQAYMDYYCDMNNKNMEYGFFKNTVDIFNVVTKEDLYTWYCTKVVWHVYNKYGIDIDSNSDQIDFTTSGLYSIVKAYYSVKYFYSSSKKNKAINDYMASAKKNIVLAEEILCSPYFHSVYERIREN